MKLSKIFPALFFLFAFIIISACKKDKVVPADAPPTLEEQFYTDCGKVPPIIACINGAKVFIPNAFSPNTDGINDVFHVFAGNGIKEIISFNIKDETGSLVFQKSNISFYFINGPNCGWDGKLPDGSIKDGIYTYTISISNNLGEITEFEGAVCCRTSFPINCVENEKHIAWSVQHDGNGGFDFNLPTYEECE